VTLEEIVSDAVRAAVTPDTGVLLSGGLDSSVVACIARECPTFTGYYEGEPYDERGYAHLAAGADHADILITPQDFCENFDAMRDAVTPPYTGPGMLGQFVVAKEVSEFIDHALTGEGADELFGGYARLMIVAGQQRPDGYSNYELPADYPRDLEAALAHDLAALAQLARVDDEIAAANGLTITAPLMNEAVVEYALALPACERVGKKVLRDAVRGLVPDEIIDRTDKRGFPVPFVHWAQEEPVRSFVHSRIGYLPDIARPWDREWWNDLMAA
jgi:asparagine synthetase B (glutamine-hydrolysing)